ncbi:hypothetical protein [Mesorhizobium sp. J8]|uniref:hypothetical protein n=1 Tax=Mesorhizobium sp. J8 TaxID=2777475 RepID=UPI001915B0C5|nr:hypothetical protein [Mesorhizobium sp. J8]BCM19164.1 hypothetical protein MJ8_29360 [Mesorhizobium sp. J8]
MGAINSGYIWVSGASDNELQKPLFCPINHWFGQHRVRDAYWQNAYPPCGALPTGSLGRT